MVTAAELAELENLTDEEKVLLTKVQARIKGWARRNKNKKRLLEEAKVSFAIMRVILQLLFSLRATACAALVGPHDLAAWRTHNLGGRQGERNVKLLSAFLL